MPVRQSIKHFAPYDVRYILILSGDQLYKMDFREVIRRHEETRADITVAGLPVAAEDTAGLGIMKMQSDGRVIAFHEKPGPESLPDLRCPMPAGRNLDDGREYLANMGSTRSARNFWLTCSRNPKAWTSARI